MPVHRVPVADVETAVATIEQTEEIIDVVESGDGALLVFTQPEPGVKRLAPGAKETR